MKLKTTLAWVGIFVFAFMPALLLFLFGPKDYSSTTHIIGQLAGLIALNFFALTFLFSTRAKWIEYLFDGLDKVYPVHAVLGATSLILILAHPIFLVLKYVPDNMNLAAKYLLPGGLLSVDLGIIALFGIVGLIIVTLYGKIKYNKWKSTHKYMGLFFILAVAHALLVRSDVARDYIFEGYYLYAAIIGAIGIGAFFYSLIRIRIIGEKYNIKKINKLTNCYEIILEPIGKGIKYEAGQFIFVSFQNKKISAELHPFSIASTKSNQIRIIVKNLGDYTSKLHELREKDIATVEGPYGMFHNKNYGNEIWIAGGIGITPFLGLAKEFAHSDRRGSIELFYSAPSKDEFICVDELKSFEKMNKKFKLNLWESNEMGYLTLNEISKSGSIHDKEYYLCGPEQLKSAIKEALIKRNISEHKIHDERFAFK